MLTPKAKRNISRITPFAIIWLLSGWIADIVKIGETNNQTFNSDTEISLTIPVLIFASLANFLVGVIVGALEVIYLEKRFSSRTLRAKFFYKFLIYLSLLIIIIVVFFPVASYLETGISLLEADAWQKLGMFLISGSFLVTLFQLSVRLMVCLLYSAISENLGHQVLLNFFTGKYHSPKEEQRIFMFLDMKESTSIAERLGHKAYFKLLQAYYEIMSDPIINSHGEVYQYIGDEVVITWSSKKGLIKNNCIGCFREIKENLRRNAASFEGKYGVVPDFKAAIHLGEVTTGEIGALKKEVIYTGDVLNTTARVQALCNEKQADLLITEDLLKGLELPNELKQEFIGELPLKGKSKPVKLYKMNL